MGGEGDKTLTLYLIISIQGYSEITQKKRWINNLDKVYLLLKFVDKYINGKIYNGNLLF